MTMYERPDRWVREFFSGGANEAESVTTATLGKRGKRGKSGSHLANGIVTVRE